MKKLKKSTMLTPVAHSRTYDVAVFIGRFQPFHNGHLKIIEVALENAHTLLLYLGSDQTAPRWDILPFTSDDREAMIRAGLTDEQNARVVIRRIVDFSNNNLWAGEVARQAYDYCIDQGMDNPKIALVGFEKDNSSFYLKLFREWDNISADGHKCQHPMFGDMILSATFLREAFLTLKPDEEWAVAEALLKASVPAGTFQWLMEYRAGAAYKKLIAEKQFMFNYMIPYNALPYGAPNFTTVDNVVFCGPYVLLVKRKHYPCKDLWALPGGHLNRDETTEEAAWRELYEETKLSVPRAVLEGSIYGYKKFDHPKRSTRGRTITFATFYDLESKSPVQEKGESAYDYRKRIRGIMNLPKIKASDDAKKAIWIRFDEIDRSQMMEDHYHIIETAWNMLANKVDKVA